jgi:glycosyltransferase involved in cell wall biosynthesis
MRLQNAWISDRTVCYLASGRPAVVQHTGPNAALDGDDGLARFRSLEEAADGINRIAGDYERQRSAARELAETHFDARKVAAAILDGALSARASQRSENASA